jgi:hypothetical protein
MSGRSKPPSVFAAFSSAPNPDRDRASYCPVLACTRRDSPFHRILFVNAQRVTRMGTMLLASRLNRVMTENRPCRFCSIAVTLATRTCVRLRARGVGGLSSATVTSPSAALSLSHSTKTYEKISAAHTCTSAGDRSAGFDRLLKRSTLKQSQARGMISCSYLRTMRVPWRSALHALPSNTH